MKLTIDYDGIRRLSSDNLFAPIHFSCSGVLFPDSEWEDFAVVILGWWFEELVQLRFKGQADLLFMEGPGFIRCELSDTKIRFQCFKDETEERAQATAYCEYKTFLKELLNVATQLLKTCSDAGHKTSDIKRLEDHLAKANRLV